MAVVDWVNVGAYDSGNGAIVPKLPLNVQAGDLMFLVNQSAALDSAPTVSPSSWVLLRNTTLGGSRLQIWYKAYESASDEPTVSDAGDHNIGFVCAFSGARTGWPWTDEQSGSTSSGVGTAQYFAPGTLLSGAYTGCYVVTFIATDNDGNSTANFTTPAGGGLTWTERADRSIGTGSGGGIGIFTAPCDSNPNFTGFSVYNSTGGNLTTHTILLNPFPQASDAVAAAEVVTVTPAQSTSVSIDAPDDATAVADAATLTVGPVRISATDAAAAADAGIISPKPFLTVADAAVAADAAVINPRPVLAASSATACADAATVALSKVLVSAADAGAIADPGTTALSGVFVSASDAVAAAEDVTATPGIAPLGIYPTPDACALADSCTVQPGSLSLSVTDAVAAADTGTCKAGPLSLPVADAAAVADTGTVRLSKVEVSAASSAAVADTSTLDVSDPSISVTDAAVGAELDPDVDLSELPTGVSVGPVYDAVVVEDVLDSSYPDTVYVAEVVTLGFGGPAGPSEVQAPEYAVAADEAAIQLGNVQMPVASHISVADSPALSVSGVKVEAKSGDNTAVADSGAISLAGVSISVTDACAVADAPVQRLSALRLAVVDAAVGGRPILVWWARIELGDVKVSAADAVVGADTGASEVGDVRISVADAAVGAGTGTASSSPVISVTDSAAVADAPAVLAPVTISVTDAAAAAETVTSRSSRQMKSWFYDLTHRDVYQRCTAYQGVTYVGAWVWIDSDHGTNGYISATLMDTDSDHMGTPLASAAGNGVVVTPSQNGWIFIPFETPYTSLYQDMLCELDIHPGYAGYYSYQIGYSTDARVSGDLCWHTTGHSWSATDDLWEDSSHPFLQPGAAPNVKDHAAVADVTTIRLRDIHLGPVIEAAAVSDTATIALSKVTVSTADAAVGADAVAINPKPVVQLTDAVAAADVAAIRLRDVHLGVAYDSAAVADTATLASVVKASSADAAAVSDAATIRVAGPKQSVTDAAAASDAATLKPGAVVQAVSDAAAVAEVVTVRGPSSLFRSDAAAVSEVVTVKASGLKLTATDATATADVCDTDVTEDEEPNFGSVITWITPTTLTPSAENSWVDHDLSGLISADATGVLIRISNSTITSRAAGVRKKGSTDTHGSSVAWGTSLTPGYTQTAVGVDANKFIQLYRSGTNITFTLLAEYGPGAVFFTNAIDVSTSQTKSWEDVDISPYMGRTPPVAAILELSYDGSSTGNGFFCRRKGSTDSLVSDGSSTNRGMVIVPVDENAVFQQYIVTTYTKLLLQGYFYDGVTMLDSALAMPNGASNVWTDYELPDWAAGVMTWGKRSSPSSKLGTRKNGDSTVVGKHSVEVESVEPDANYIVEHIFTGDTVTYIIGYYGTPPAAAVHDSAAVAEVVTLSKRVNPWDSAAISDRADVKVSAVIITAADSMAASDVMTHLIAYPLAFVWYYNGETGEGGLWNGTDIIEWQLE